MIRTTVGKYHIVDKIGEGGMGTVWKAEDPTLGRLVAMKALSASLADDPEAKERFVREAQAASALNHPNIATIYELLEDEGRHFIVMEYVEGKTVRDMAESGTVSVKKAVDLLTQAAEGLEAAHSKGILHRDIKSANIMVTMEGRVKIMDFGLASLEKRSKLTRTGTTMGTLAYSSPEQITGRPVDGRSEVFALGVVFYELLTGRLPFSDTTEGELVFAIINNEPPAVDTIRTDLPPDLVGIVRGMLEKDPDDRYEYCNQVIADLKAVRRGFETTTTVISAMPARAGRAWWKPIAAVATVGLLIWVGIALTRRPAETRGIRIAVLPFEFRTGEGDEAFADGLTESVMNRLTGVGGLDVLSSRSTFAYKGKEKTLTEIGRELYADYILTGTLRRLGEVGAEDDRIQVSPELVRSTDQSRVWSGFFDRAHQQVMALEGDIAEGVIHELGMTADARSSLGGDSQLTEDPEAYAAYARGRSLGLVHAEAELEKGIRFFRLAVEKDPGFAEAHAGLARFHGHFVNWGIDRSPERLAMGQREADLALALSPKSALVHRDVAWFYYHGLRDLDRALAEFTRAGEGLPGDVDILEGVAFVLRRQGRLKEALQRLERAVELDPNNHLVIWDAGNTAAGMGQYGKAVEYHDRAISIFTDPNYFESLYQAVLSESEDLSKAEKVLIRRDRILQESDLWLWVDLEYLSGRFTEAIARLDQVQDPLGIDQFSLKIPSLSRGMIYRVMGRQEDARHEFETARDLLLPQISENDTDPRFHAALGIAYAGLGSAPDALREGSRAMDLMPWTRDVWEAWSYGISMAQIHVLLGRFPEAVEMIGACREARPGSFVARFTRLDPLWEPFRSMPEFKRLFR